MKHRAYSFAAGPAIWPDEVLDRIASGVAPRPDLGISVLEMSHRSPEYRRIHDGVIARLAELLAVPDGFSILLLPGGATMQFAMVPANLRDAVARDDERRPAAFVVTGSWSKKALDFARRTGPVHVAASGEADRFCAVPDPSSWEVPPQAAYLHLTANNTIFGTRVPFPARRLPVAVVVDASSDLMTRPIPWDRVDLVYAGGQKSLGPAGIAVVVIRDELVVDAPRLPPMLSYAAHRAADSLLNTPPTALIWMMGLMLDWIAAEGGAGEMAARAERRAAIVYRALDDADEVYELPVRREDRSPTNVVFRLRAPDRDEAFLAGARERGLVGLKGHRSVGGFRASLYNGMPLAGAEALAAWIREFAGR